MRLPVLLLAFWSSAVIAEPASEGSEWLLRMASASREVSFVGTFMYQRGDFNETTRIAHRSESGQSIDHLETLSGRQREIVRVGQDVTWYMPESKTVRTERQSYRRFFPDLFGPERARTVSQFYEISRAGTDRVAGYDCVNYVLTPKDNFRYRQSICAETKTWLPLRVATVNERQDRLETFAFSQLQLLPKIDPNDLRVRNPDTSGWTQESAAQAADPAFGNWFFRELPAGFAMVSESQRVMPGRPQPVIHKVLSDGMVWVSVFIEPLSNTPAIGRGLSQQGGANAYSRPIGNHHVTVVGLVPVQTLVLIGGALTQRNAAP